ncbi:MAG: NADP-dependent oxidoreductase [Terriglobales bacterium]
MKAVRFHEFGGSDKLKIEELPRPQPQAGEVLVGIRSIGVNPVDWKIRAGRTRFAQTLPSTSGQDFAGMVEARAPDVVEFPLAARVYGFARGSYAEYALARADEIATLPESVSFETAAALPTPGVTALQLLQAADLRPGAAVLIHGAGGSVGSLATQLAVRAGARVTATTLGADVAFVSKLGAERVMDNAKEQFENLAGKVDAVLDLVGGEIQRRSYEVLRDEGVLVSTVGIVDEAAAKRWGVHTIALLMRRDRDDLKRLIGMVERGELRVRIAQVLPFPQARQAQDLTERGGAQGKVLMRVA